MKTIITNRRARYEYEIQLEIDCGLVLEGSEVKSLRAGNATLVDSFIFIKNNEVWIKNLIIAKYKHSHTLVEHIENRDKKLLLNRKEILKVGKMLDDKGTTAIPLSIFNFNNKLKIKIGIGRGKKLYDKKNSIKERDIKRDVDRTLNIKI